MAGGHFLGGGAEPDAGQRIKQPQRAIPHAQVQPQQRAVSPQDAAGVPAHRNGLPAPVHQPFPLQQRGKALPQRVKTPVFGYAKQGVQRPLDADVPMVGAVRRHFYDEVRRLAALPPDEIGTAHPLGGAEHHQHIGGHPRAGVAHAVIDENVASHIDIGAVFVPHAQGVDSIGNGAVLVIGFGQGFTVRIGVVDAGVVVVGARFRLRDGGGGFGYHSGLPPAGMGGL